MNVRTFARSAGVEALSLLAAAKQYPNLVEPRVHFVYLHSLPQDREVGFERFVRWIAQKHDLVSYSDAVALLHGGESLSRPVACFSTDDAFRSSIRVAEILEQYGTRLCIFAPTDLVGVDSPAAIEAFFGTHEGVEPEVLSWDDLSRLVDRGHEVGSHTVSHCNLGESPIDVVRTELEWSRAVLIERLGQGTHFAWPYGRSIHASPAVVDLAFEAGYVSVASATRGCHKHGNDTGGVILRDHIDPVWPMRHSKMFLDRSASRPVTTNLARQELWEAK